MARCTAPVMGHRSAAAAANCPACGGRYGRSRSYGGYGSSYGSSASTPYSPMSNSSGRTTGGSGRRTTKPRWSGSSSAAWYTPEQVLALTPIRENVESLAVSQPDLRDVFLCHAWDDRQGSAKELHDLLEARGVRVWFSEKDLGLGVPMMRAIDKGLVNSRVGIVLVTPAMLRRLPAEGVADKKLSALLRRERLVPVVHGTTYEELEHVSLLLASRAGLSTAEEPMAEVAAKIAELVAT
ncbi:toll/interleukin-1 receptor domain-containing protein [Hoeflea sp. E7-10]|uniref:Toll/interleukin-1 receptor domain-containing protein n=2 Tax=Hoeflea poritis TaxID=2993659 RepID=A0ABT4VUM7_9HYPH|nr:toll/interleukin-1 receptor domain-containing protein [Hoeflea poritis]MDA4848416.1 toll/interleukin-1 receptor domain-containing protein [Hoeflea poritis]